MNTVLLIVVVLQGLFSQGIGQSGSALSPWAFDKEGPFNARNYAADINCTGTDDQIALCMRDEKTFKEIKEAFGHYSVSI